MFLKKIYIVVCLLITSTSVYAQQELDINLSNHLKFATSLAHPRVIGWSYSVKLIKNSSLHNIEGKILRADWDHQPSQEEISALNSKILDSNFNTWKTKESTKGREVTNRLKDPFLESIIVIMLEEINNLRASQGLPKITKKQFFNRIKTKVATQINN